VRFSRFFWFLVSILIGATAGLVIGWYLHPFPIGEVPLTALRSDYQADYVLMVAEIFETEKDLPKAVQRLGFLKSETPVRLVQLSVKQADELGYDRRDLELLAKLAQALLTNASSGNKP
jgi:hypothetical protein